uniref:Uncharacterized protein n=1 Tax=Arundo donax TaxID=35708 RepID=A0A0A9EFW2_ARUDO
MIFSLFVYIVLMKSTPHELIFLFIFSKRKVKTCHYCIVFFYHGYY